MQNTTRNHRSPELFLFLASPYAHSPQKNEMISNTSATASS